jgi:hypothetical protein
MDAAMGGGGGGGFGFGFGEEEEEEEVKIDPDEIVAQPDLDMCYDCHNEESPTFKEFCANQAVKKVQHLNPKKEHDPDRYADHYCKEDPCPVCKDETKRPPEEEKE